MLHKWQEYGIQIYFVHACIQIRRRTYLDGSIHMWFMWYVLRYNGVGHDDEDNCLPSEARRALIERKTLLWMNWMEWQKLNIKWWDTYRGSGEGKCQFNLCAHTQAYKCKFLFFSRACSLKIADMFDLNCTSQITCSKNRNLVSCTCGMHFFFVFGSCWRSISLLNCILMNCL